ncbi:Retrovirus-related Pol polyprotein from transposon TNT 1-94 [Gossypium australe]|uniref:Retrovirus-related Pol polyprotein from transposon TNT 1-94 n=1 Tax=Gossypium australe TaxID=47621 RepID=A0A5B6VQ60_9ROSI|nr:Retrovirus-related Pol polyprotein from transposon TNT 1-94 [Gossypium australe]
MTSKCNHVVCSIEESRDTSIVAIDELQSNFLVHEQRIGSHNEEEHALKITHRDHSGCSNHMCGNKEYFSNFDENSKDLMKLGNNTSMVVIRRGNVRL